MSVTLSPYFQCGHPRSTENSASNGNSRVICRECRNTRQRRNHHADLEKSRAAARERTMRYRRKKGVKEGHPSARKDSCPEGHPYDAENTYLRNGTRQCRTCRRARATAWHHAKRSNGGDHTEQEWLDLCALFGHCCLRCGQVAPLTRDHVVPVSKGGTNDIANIQPLCRPCNSAKKNQTIDYRPLVAVA